MLKIQEFAKRGGVSIRAVRHYDSLGLLKPSARSRSGYRLYEESDLRRLEQIIALRAFGLSLTDIGRALKYKSALPDALRRQQQALLEQRGGDVASRLEQARTQVMERRRQWMPQPEDFAIMRDIKAAIEREETPASPSARVLIDRLKAAIDRFSGGDPELRTAITLVMAEQVNWPGPPIGAKFRAFFTEATAA